MKNRTCLAKLRTLAICLLPFVFLSCGKNEKLAVYSCKLKHDADTCAEGCELDNEIHHSFIVSKEEKSVFQIVYWDGKQKGSLLHKNCTIFDNFNWDCSESTEMPFSVWHNTTKMTNGVFTQLDERTRSSDLKSLNPLDKGTCSKPTSLNFFR